jgi:ACS family D-galactonate transporter-like MFS transporter
MSLKAHWKILLFLFLATVLNYMDRQTLSVSSPLIQKEFALSNEQLGLLFSAFFISYAVSVALIGEFIDRLSIRTAFICVVSWWSIATMLTAFSKNFWYLFGFRMLLGIGEAGLWPATARLVSLYIEAKDRTLANSFYMAGGSLGLVLIQPLMIWLSLAHGWRMGYFIIGGLSSFWLLAWVLWFKPPAKVPIDETANAEAATSWSPIVRSPRFWGFMLASFCGNTTLYFLMNWLPTFLIQDRHFVYNLKLGGVILIPFLGLDAGYMASGFAVLRLSKIRPVLQVRRWAIGLAAVLTASALIYTPFSQSSVVAVAALFVTTFGMAVWNSNYLSGVEEISSVKPAAVAGVIGSIGALGGAISLWLIGVMSELPGGFKSVFIMIGLLILVGSLGILLTEKRSIAAGHAATFMQLEKEL